MTGRSAQEGKCLSLPRNRWETAAPQVTDAVRDNACPSSVRAYSRADFFPPRTILAMDKTFNRVICGGAEILAPRETSNKRSPARLAALLLWFVPPFPFPDVSD